MYFTIHMHAHQTIASNFHTHTTKKMHHLYSRIKYLDDDSFIDPDKYEQKMYKWYVNFLV